MTIEGRPNIRIPEYEREVFIELDRRANCKDSDTALFFSSDPRDIDEAKVICDACKVRQLCLDFAVASHQDSGVWGGEYILDGVVRWGSNVSPSVERRRKNDEKSA